MFDFLTRGKSWALQLSLFENFAVTQINFAREIKTARKKMRLSKNPFSFRKSQVPIARMRMI